MKRKYVVTGLAVLAVGMTGVGVYSLVDRGRDPDTSVKGASVVAPQVGLRVYRDPTIIEQAIDEDEEAKGQLWKLTQPAEAKEEFQVTAVYEQGVSLTKLTRLTRTSLREAVVGNINLQLPKSYAGYTKISQRNLNINGVEANETIFEYQSRGTRVRQRLLLLFKNSDTVVYLRGQVRSVDYDTVNEKYFEPLFSSAKFE